MLLKWSCIPKAIIVEKEGKEDAFKSEKKHKKRRG
jgi:hypothetical protein